MHDCRHPGNGKGAMSVRLHDTTQRDGTVRLQQRRAGRYQRGMTLTEVLVASSLLLVAMVPILKALTIGQTTGTIIEWRTCSLALAQGKLDQIRARSVYHYDESFEENSTPLGGRYLCTVGDDEDSTLRLITVAVGYDQNEDEVLADDEVQVTLATYVARR